MNKTDRSFRNAQAAWDNATPPDCNDELEEEAEEGSCKIVNTECKGCRKRRCGDCPV